SWASASRGRGSWRRLEVGVGARARAHPRARAVAPAGGRARTRDELELLPHGARAALGDVHEEGRLVEVPPGHPKALVDGAGGGHGARCTAPLCSAGAGEPPVTASLVVGL